MNNDSGSDMHAAQTHGGILKQQRHGENAHVDNNGPGSDLYVAQAHGRTQQRHGQNTHDDNYSDMHSPDTRTDADPYINTAKAGLYAHTHDKNDHLDTAHTTDADPYCDTAEGDQYARDQNDHLDSSHTAADADPYSHMAERDRCAHRSGAGSYARDQNDHLDPSHTATGADPHSHMAEEGDQHACDSNNDNVDMHQEGDGGYTDTGMGIEFPPVQHKIDMQLLMILQELLTRQLDDRVKMSLVEQVINRHVDTVVAAQRETAYEAFKVCMSVYCQYGYVRICVYMCI